MRFPLLFSSGLFIVNNVLALLRTFLNFINLNDTHTVGAFLKAPHTVELNVRSWSIPSHTVLYSYDPVGCCWYGLYYRPVGCLNWLNNNPPPPTPHTPAPVLVIKYGILHPSHPQSISYLIFPPLPFIFRPFAHKISPNSSFHFLPFSLPHSPFRLLISFTFSLSICHSFAFPLCFSIFFRRFYCFSLLIFLLFFLLVSFSISLWLVSFFLSVSFWLSPSSFLLFSFTSTINWSWGSFPLFTGFTQSCLFLILFSSSFLPCSFLFLLPTLFLPLTA